MRSGVMWASMNTLLRAAVISVMGLGCGVDRLQHSPDLVDLGVADAAVTVDAGFDAGVDAGIPDAGFDAGIPDAGEPDAGFDAGFDAGSTDAGLDGGGCTAAGISPELAAVSGGPYQNCQGGVIPRTDFQQNTTAWSGCCGELVRVCAVTGFSTQNALYCR